MHVVFQTLFSEEDSETDDELPTDDILGSDDVGSEVSVESGNSVMLAA